jgi:hypothetical protein
MYSLMLTGILWTFGPAPSGPLELPKASRTTVSAPAGVSRALIVVGIPGDKEHQESFASVARDWKDWLTHTLSFSSSEVRILFGKDPEQGLAKSPATRAALEKEVASLREVLKPDDRLWVFLLGHGNYDGERAYFHLAGRDLPAEELGKLFAGLRCKEQVFWLTAPASGWMLRFFSAKGRTVICATLADDEYNETEFPYALATVVKRPAGDLDTNKDGKVSLLELYNLTVAEVNTRFARDKRAPTEHAQLDDNGNGTGTEQPRAGEASGGRQPPDNNKTRPDGALAATTYLPLKH